LVSVNDDGSDKEVLAQRQQKGEFSYNQDEIVDWLPNDPKNILIEVLEDKGDDDVGNASVNRGEGVSKVNIYSNRMKKIERVRIGTFGWMADGHGKLKIRQKWSKRDIKLLYRNDSDATWRLLHRNTPDDSKDKYLPIGFGENTDHLYVFDDHEGRRALFREDLAKELERVLVYAHPQVDLSGVAVLGKYRRMVGVTYVTDKPHTEYFDKSIRQLRSRVASHLPDMALSLIGESWDQRYYLVLAESDTHGGTYYRFDTKTDQLSEITKLFPKLEDIELGKMTSFTYKSDDGVEIPSYLTLPPDSDGEKPLPTIVLPHGGPKSRDSWGFDWLAQFFVSQGYAVLQSNYRGSGGYGDEWTGDGAFREWKRAMTDIEYGLRHLVEQGLSDPDRICAVGWSYGGYAALLSAIEFPERYRCVVSIAGVSDPVLLVRDDWGLSQKYMKSLISRKTEDVEGGSPRKRASEIQVPVLLFPGDRDVNVPIKHSELMETALRRAKKQVELVEYKDVDHGIPRQKLRIDMLRRIGIFLDENLTPRDSN
jgi:dipeptidyl aminopeptidase/acylaminoacyl peptidase